MRQMATRGQLVFLAIEPKVCPNCHALLCGTSPAIDFIRQLQVAALLVAPFITLFSGSQLPSLLAFLFHWHRSARECYLINHIMQRKSFIMGAILIVGLVCVAQEASTILPSLPSICITERICAELTVYWALRNRQSFHLTCGRA